MSLFDWLVGKDPLPEEAAPWVDRVKQGEERAEHFHGSLADAGFRLAETSSQCMTTSAAYVEMGGWRYFRGIETAPTPEEISVILNVCQGELFAHGGKTCAIDSAHCLGVLTWLVREARKGEGQSEWRSGSFSEEKLARTMRMIGE